MIGDPPYAPHGEGDHSSKANGGGAATLRHARRLRRTTSLPEVLPWERLRRRAGGVKFRRQHPFGPYVLDFYCASARLAVEIDGAAHEFASRPARDLKRTRLLQAHGLAIVRLAAGEVLRDRDVGAGRIARAALSLRQPAAGPPPHAAHGAELHGAA